MSLSIPMEENEGPEQQPTQVESSKPGTKKLPMEYILPLKWGQGTATKEMTDYLRQLGRWVDVTVVDGSVAEVFATHHARWGSLVRHIAPEGPVLPNGKVHGVLTGLLAARHERIIIADDDVRYALSDLQRMFTLLDCVDLVRPQNYFSPAPWHARWDTGRTLLNRALGSDYPGTLGLRRRCLPHGYRGDALFENLELIRTALAQGSEQIRADDFFIPRLPPTNRHFLNQRIRQAYDSQAQPSRLAAELSLLPLLLLQSRRPEGYIFWLVLILALSNWGRHKKHGSEVFPRSSPLWAPLWVAERSLTSWLAVGARLRGGIKYSGGRIKDAASPPSSLPTRSTIVSPPQPRHRR